MKNLHSIILILIVLAGGLWYGGRWVYTTQYSAPRQKEQARIDQAVMQMEVGKRNLQMMRETITANQGAYMRSLPLSRGSARSLYQFWLLELLKYCDLTEQDITPVNPVQTNFCYQYRFQVRGRGSLDQISRFLYQFYWAPFLHRIVSMSISPVEGSELADLMVTVEAIAIPPAAVDASFPLRDRLPNGYYRRLASGPFSTYRLIAERNLLQHARGGVDKADFTYLTSIQRINGVPEIWLTVRTTKTILKLKVGDRVEIGSFIGTLHDIGERDVIFERGGLLWLVTAGDSLQKAFAIPPEAAPPTLLRE